ncbi:MAG: hypothetical protein GOV15_02060 [Candidatus Diapherotrites archaeon]|nr:hypothetical protein [Candidatus Diapherotrites archaeon]
MIGSRGSSPVATTVLIVAVGVVLIASSFLWARGLEQATVSKQTDIIREQQEGTGLVIQGGQLASDNTIAFIMIKNEGDANLTNVSLFIDGQLVCEGKTAATSVLTKFDSSNCADIGTVDASNPNLEVTISAETGSERKYLFEVLESS